MNRRNFLKGLALSAGGILVGAEILKEKTYFLPPSGGWRVEYDFKPLYGANQHPIMVGLGKGKLYMGDTLIGDIEGLEWKPQENIVVRLPNEEYDHVSYYAGYMRQHL